MFVQSKTSESGKNMEHSTSSLTLWTLVMNLKLVFDYTFYFSHRNPPLVIHWAI